MKINNKDSFWPSYVDVMTTLFAIMVVLFSVSYSRFKINEKALKMIADKYEEIQSIYKSVENIDSTYFEFNKQYVKHIFRIQVTYQKGKFGLDQLVEDVADPKAAAMLRMKIIEAGYEIERTIEALQRSESKKQDIKYLVVIEGQASADGYHVDDYFNNDVLSYQRALALHRFWKENAGIDFSHMDKCELLICGSGEGGVPRYSKDDIRKKDAADGLAGGSKQSSDYERYNQRFMIHIVPVIGDIKLDD